MDLERVTMDNGHEKRDNEQHEKDSNSAADWRESLAGQSNIGGGIRA